jgi:hypothetical protein
LALETLGTIGGLGLSAAAARERDRLVLTACGGAGVPVVIVLAGGYPRSLDTLVEMHCATFDEAKRLLEHRHAGNSLQIDYFS